MIAICLHHWLAAGADHSRSKAGLSAEMVARLEGLAAAQGSKFVQYLWLREAGVVIAQDEPVTEIVLVH